VSTAENPSLPSLDRLHETWDGLAAVDPFWAVLSSAEHRLGGWDPESFYATGREEIDELIGELAARDLPVARGTALDFGCGVGRLSRGLAPYFDSVIGIDLSSRMVELARQLTPEPNVRYLVNRSDHLALVADGSVDFLYTGRVLQHVPPELTRAYLTEFLRVLAPGGLAVFQIPSAIRGGRPEDAALPAEAYHARLIVGDVPAELAAGEAVEIEVTVVNDSPLDWPGVDGLGLYQLRLGNHWRHADGRLERLDDGRTPLGTGLAAGARRTLRARVAAPLEPGEYDLEMDLVQELVAWFGDRGSPPSRRPVRVRRGEPMASSAEAGPAVHHAIEMHTLPRESVASVVHGAGGDLVHSRLDGLAGPEWESTTYFVRKNPSRFVRWWRQRFARGGQVALGAALALAGCAAVEPPPRPHGGYRGANVVLISIDTLRADRLSVYGYGRPTSPNLERFAAEGVLFERFYYNGGGTLPSHMSMMTSLYPGTHKLHPNLTKSLEPERVTLAEVFQVAGYATGGFADVGYLQAKWGFDQGFDVYDDAGHKFAGILPKARRWLDAHHDRPFFLFLHTYDVHSNSIRLPYECPGEYPFRYTGGPHPSFDGCRGGRCASDFLAHANVALRTGRTTPPEILAPDELAFVSSLYDGCINYVDDRIAEVLGWLDELGLAEETLVVVTSDHGEEFLEHGYLLHDQGGYEELAHIPLLLRLPDRAHGGTRVEHLAEMVDLMPTVLDLVGLPLPGDAQGASLVPTFRDDRPVTEAVHMYSILRTDRYKYFKDEKQLFDLIFDPTERRDLFRTARWRSARLDRQVRALIKADFRAADEFAARATAGRPAVLTPAEQARLKSLGYLK
jgi:arylsulfatase A-like enzyme/SAM-dependent methyltransferase